MEPVDCDTPLSSTAAPVINLRQVSQGKDVPFGLPLLHLVLFSLDVLIITRYDGNRQWTSAKGTQKRAVTDPLAVESLSTSSHKVSLLQKHANMVM